jgi:hypothetical protein
MDHLVPTPESFEIMINSTFDKKIKTGRPFSLPMVETLFQVFKEVITFRRQPGLVFNHFSPFAVQSIIIDNLFRLN